MRGCPPGFRDSTTCSRAASRPGASSPSPADRGRARRSSARSSYTSAPGILGAEILNPGMQEFIADGVLHFHLVPVAGDARVRYIEITKMRGTNHQMGPIPIDIGNHGISVRLSHIPGRK